MKTSEALTFIAGVFFAVASTDFSVDYVALIDHGLMDYIRSPGGC
ncbi:MAG: hypothetical protein ACLUI3_16375 [Christensenellales bacterium]